MTGQEIVNEIKSDINQLGSSGHFTDAQLLEFVNEGYIDFCRYTEALEKSDTSTLAKECVDIIVTDLAVIEVTSKGLPLKEVAPGWTAEEVQALTEARLIVADDLKEVEL